MAKQYASKVEIHWPDGQIESWSSVYVLRVSTKIGDAPVKYITVTLMEDFKDGESSGTTG